MCLPSEDYVDYDNVKVMISGYKPNKYGAWDHLNLTKSFMQLTMRSDEECEARIKHSVFNPDEMLCTFDDEGDLAADADPVTSNEFLSNCSFIN